MVVMIPIRIQGMWILMWINMLKRELTLWIKICIIIIMRMVPLMNWTWPSRKLLPVLLKDMLGWLLSQRRISTQPRLLRRILLMIYILAPYGL